MDYKKIFTKKEQEIIYTFLKFLQPNNIGFLGNLNNQQIKDCKNILKAFKILTK